MRAAAPATTPRIIVNAKTASAAPTNQPGHAGWSSLASDDPKASPAPMPVTVSSSAEGSGRRPAAAAVDGAGDRAGEHPGGERQPDPLTGGFEEVHGGGEGSERR